MFRIKAIFTSLAFLFQLATVSSPVYAAEFKFTAIPDQDTARLQQRFGKVAEYLSNELGIKVIYVPVKSYAASVQAFKNNEVQMAWFGGLSGVQARLAVPGSVAVAQGEEDDHFISYIIAHASTGLTEGQGLPAEIAEKNLHLRLKGFNLGPAYARILYS